MDARTRQWGLVCMPMLFAACLLVTCARERAPATEPAHVADEPRPQEDSAAHPLGGIRQLTFAGRRSGEGYFDASGARLVFQSERQAQNPFYQIYLLELSSGDVTRVSPGHGKTTCGWIHPDGERVLFASTHHDPQSREKQRAELEFRATGQARRYAWDYDEEFELWSARADGAALRRLTHARGYDAEGSYSPDGEWIAFASNRHAYVGELSPEERERFALDPSSQVDLYLMRADGSGVRRLTTTAGYDGGPFFSPDGSRIVWRRFSIDGLTAEIFTMAVDGSDVRQLTRLAAMSWAPFFHPSGEYVIFATNLHGFGNFELYLVDARGRAAPQRVTSSDGFDGLPAFSPDGGRLVWTSGRSADGRSQLFTADWDHGAARGLLRAQAAAAPALPVPPTAQPGRAAVRGEDLRRHVDALTAPAMAGRATGSEGERLATEYVARIFAELGLLPAGDGSSFYQEFEFTAGVSPGPANELVLVTAAGSRTSAPGRAWRPLALSRVGRAEPSPVVFAGYGIVAPAEGEWAAYDSYAELDVRDKWVLALRFLPERVPRARRQQLSRYAGVRYKAMLARERGALGLLLATGPHSEVRDPLVALARDVALASTSIYGLSLNAELAGQLLAPSGRDLGELQRALDGGEPLPGFELAGVDVGAFVDLVQEKRTGRNVLARQRGAHADAPAVLVGAHVDHLGRARAGSLAREDEAGQIHPGADDNASGVAGLLEIAESLALDGEALERDLVFAAWSGEELGLLGSNHYAGALPGANPHGAAPRGLSAYLNLDMIGRFDGELVLHGVGSSSIWEREIERRNVPIGLPVAAQRESYLPTDATSFYLAGVPVLSAFTGAHEEYHTPRDTAEKLDYEAAARIAALMGAIARSLARSPELPDYVEMQRPAAGTSRGGIRVYLGTIPNYARADTVGVALSGVVAGGPAARAGLRAGDVVVSLAGQAVENIYDYTYALESLAVGETVDLEVVREGERVVLRVTPESRQ